jgi:hypothetical protein
LEAAPPQSCYHGQTPVADDRAILEDKVRVVMRQSVWKMLPIVLVLAGVPGWSPCRAAETAAPAPAPRPAEERLKRDVTYLASDECEGRGPTTRGINLAADYIAAEFKKAGLTPGGVEGTWFQPFTIPTAVLDAPATLALTGPKGQRIELKQGVQFWPMGLGKAGKDTAPIVFAGYGITNEKARYDDYAGLDAADKIVIVLRGSPKPANTDPGRALFSGAPFTVKLANAEKHRAAALLVVNDSETARSGDDLIDFSFTALERRAGPLPAFHVRRDVLQTMLGSRGEDLDDLERAIDRDLAPQSRALTGWSAAFDLKMHRDNLTLKNVVGVLEGAGPLARETIVVGAHYDHLGYGSFGSLARSKKMAIHHGADDNGSGTTALMELARRFGAQRDRQGRRLVFIAFSGEEMGLFGSAHYCKKPLFPLADTAAMFNLDMVGRLRPDAKTGKDKLLTEGSGTAKPFLDLLDRLAGKHDFTMVNKPSGFGPSDHASFCGAKVPVLFVWTGYHDDYHRPSDTADKINVAGMKKVVDLSEEAVGALAAMTPRPAYIEIKRPAMPRAGNGPRLGFMPAYDDAGEGVLIGDVGEGPANRAGLKKDDRIVEIAGKPVKDLTTYMTIMQGQKNGDTIEVIVVRNGKKVPFKVKLD